MSDEELASKIKYLEDVRDSSNDALTTTGEEDLAILTELKSQRAVSEKARELKQTDENDTSRFHWIKKELGQKFNALDEARCKAGGGE